MGDVKRYDSATRQMYEGADGNFVLHSDYATILARHNALVEAVAWERECSKFFSVVFMWYCPSELPEILKAARAEVDRLIADCKGEG